MRKTLRNNVEVAHVWAAQSQSEGSGYHLFFEGPSIFSYGHHFEVARIVRPGVVLFNASSYSNSTSRHQGIAHDAVLHMRMFRVPELKWETPVDHNKSAAFYIDTLTERLYTISRMRSDSSWALEDYARQAQEAAAYVLEFGAKIRKPLQRAIADIYEKREAPLTPDQVAKLVARAAADRERAKKVREQQARALELRKQIAQKDSDAWKAGADVRLDWEMQKLFPVALRVIDGEIQTTRGASVPVIEARKLWHMLKAGTDIAGMRLGHYTVTRIEAGNLLVGCHTIPMREVARMAVTLGLESEAA